MESQAYPSLQSLNRAHGRLAINARRVTQIVNTQLDGIERLFNAAISGDWEAIAQASRFLARQEPNSLDAVVIHEARKLCEELAATRSRISGPKHLASLIEACRNVRQRQSG